MSTQYGKPRGYYERCLAVDCETTGINFNAFDPSEGYQSIAWGVIVVDVATWTAIEDLYVEIKWDGKSIWAPEAEKVHGLSREYLEANGVEEQEAVAKIGELLLKHWGPNGNIRLLGHNVATFDRAFLHAMFKRHGINLKLGNRHIDSSTAGMVTFGSFNSDDLFDVIGLEARDDSKHNALVDAYYSLEAVRTISTLFKNVVLEQNT